MTVGTVLVTGGSSGLGAAVIAGVKDAGGRPVNLDRVKSEADTDQEIVDLSDARAAEEAVRAVSRRVGGIDAVVTSAGIDACGKLEDVAAEDWDKVILVNLIGTAAVVRAALPDLLERRGHVVTVASTLGVRALSDATAYSASKFGIVGFTRALAAETQGRISTTMLVPGGMHTHFFEGRDPQYMPPPDAKLNQPENVAAAVLFALQQPEGCEIRELVVTPAVEGSWP
jgi:NADP-dependent 3-hydroxy acid dehydrogenase YdfG